MKKQDLAQFTLISRPGTVVENIKNPLSQSENSFIFLTDFLEQT